MITNQQGLAQLVLTIVDHGGQANPGNGAANGTETLRLASIGREHRMSNAECSALPPDQRRIAEQAVEDVVAEKIETYLLSADKAALFD